MFTPADLEEISFERSAFGGYKLDEVERFVNKITAEYVSLYNENEELKKKLKIVVDKIESYRTKEALISEALLSAQSEKNAAAIEADRVVNEARATAEKMIAEGGIEAEKQTALARENADRKIADMDAEVEAQRKHLEAVRKEVSDFKLRIQELYKNHLTNIMAIPSYEKHEAAVPETPAAEHAEAAPSADVSAEQESFDISDVSDENDDSTEAAAEADVAKAVAEADAYEELHTVSHGHKPAAEPLSIPRQNDGQQSLFNQKSGLSDVFDFDADDSVKDNSMSFVLKKKKK